MSKSGIVLFCIAVAAMTMIFLHSWGDTEPAAPNAPDAAYQSRMSEVTSGLASKGLSVTWPSGGQYDVLRVDLPRTSSAVDGHTGRQIAQDVYSAFVQARQDSGISDPYACIVHVFDDTGKEVGGFSQSGASG